MQFDFGGLVFDCMIEQEMGSAFDSHNYGLIYSGGLILINCI